MPDQSATSVLWFRRDLRLGDHPALVEAARDSSVVPLFVLDLRLLASAGAPRRQRLMDSLHALREQTDGALVVRAGDPVDVVPAVATEAGAGAVHASRESTPYGGRRDEAVAAALAENGIGWQTTGSPYALGPGSVVKEDGSGYQVFTPFARAWREHGWPDPAPAEPDVDWSSLPSDTDLDDASGQPAGEEAAREKWAAYLDDGLTEYAAQRDLPAQDATSRLSPHLKLGEIHPRTLLADIAARPDAAAEGPATFVTELCWREFYADILWRHPHSAWHDLRQELSGLDYDDPGEEMDLWRQGRTGYPIVDAGMRQLLAEGWMHNRLRMITGSFLTKDLHVWWPHGARHFLDHLIDGDLASNNHGWQWVAGTGTDAAPYFRVFNPVTQGERFDPDGAYVRRWVPELAHLPGKAAHQPWKHPDGYAHGYPQRILDHADERREALRRYERARSR